MSFKVGNVVRLTYNDFLAGVVVEVDNETGAKLRNRAIFLDGGKVWMNAWYMDGELCLIDSGEWKQ